MPFEIVRNDITKMEVDAIVNSANPRPMVGLGTDSSIHEAAGPELLAERKKIGPIAPGDAAVTPAFGLPAKYVIHTVGPVWQGGDREEEALLRSCYDRSLRLALEHGCRSVAFPLIATHNYGFPKDKALQIAISAFTAFLTEFEIQIYLVVFDQNAYRLSEKLFQGVATYIDQHYVDVWEQAVYGPKGNTREQRMSRQRDMSLYEYPIAAKMMPTCAPSAKPQKKSLADILKKTDAGFTEMLLKLIDKTGKKDSEIYKKANISKQHFSKIRNNPAYQPTKATAIALAIALELDMKATKDLIGRAGFALTNSSKFDLIISYFIEQGNYNVMEINLALYEFDQVLLGGKE